MGNGDFRGYEWADHAGFKGTYRLTNDGQILFNTIDRAARGADEYIVSRDDFTPLPLNIGLEEIRIMVDIALAFNDKQWLKELGYKLSCFKKAR
jgi:hypothetical protein